MAGVYPEEIAENPSLGMVQLYYFPAKTANAKYAIVVPGNGGNTTAELNEGASIANQLHELRNQGLKYSTACTARAWPCSGTKCPPVAKR